MNLNEQLKELSFQMMLNEMRKMQIENSRSFAKETGNTASIYSSDEGCHRGLMEADRKGYELSLKFNELLLQNSKKHNNFDSGPDAANISAENLLHKYGLNYPISWYVEYEDRDGLHFGYYKSDTIDRKHDEYLRKVENLLRDGKINNNTRERLIVAGEYYRSHRYLLSQYHNHEEIKESGISR